MTPTKPMFTVDDWFLACDCSVGYSGETKPHSDTCLATQATEHANHLVQPLVDENARLKDACVVSAKERDATFNWNTLLIHERDLLAKENAKLRAALEELLKAWTAYFNPDVGPPGDENKQLLFNQWTDTVAKTYEAIK